MDVKTAFFYLFSLVMLFSAFRVITARNPVHAVLFLMLAFSQAAGVWLLLKAEFLAIVLVLVYLGAVMVLFLFVVMMLDIHIDSLRQGFWRHFPLALGMGAVISLEMAVVLFGGFRAGEAPGVPETVTNAAGQLVQYSNTKALGTLMYTEYLYPMEIAAVILGWPFHLSRKARVTVLVSSRFACPGTGKSIQVSPRMARRPALSTEAATSDSK